MTDNRYILVRVQEDAHAGGFTNGVSLVRQAIHEVAEVYDLQLSDMAFDPEPKPWNRFRGENLHPSLDEVFTEVLEHAKTTSAEIASRPRSILHTTVQARMADTLEMKRRVVARKLKARQARIERDVERAMKKPADLRKQLADDVAEFEREHGSIEEYAAKSTEGVPSIFNREAREARR